MSIKTAVFTVFLAIFSFSCFGQSCLPKGALRWVTEKGLAADYMAEYSSEASILGLFFSRKAYDSLQFFFSTKPDFSTTITYPVIPIRNRLKTLSSLSFSKYFYFIPVSPKVLKDKNAAHTRFARLLVQASELGNNYVVLDYSIPKIPSLRGCIAIDLRADSNKYAQLDSYVNATLRIQNLRQEIVSHEDSLVYLETQRQAYWTQLLAQRDKLSPIREKITQLPDIHKKALLEIINLLDNITYAKQQFSSGLIDDESRITDMLTEYTSLLIRYKNAAPNLKAAELLYQYSSAVEGLQHYYATIANMQQVIKDKKLKINDLYLEKSNLEKILERGGY